MRIIVFMTIGGASRLVAELDPDSYRLLPCGLHDSEVSPRHVEAIIRHALSLGWAPTVRGPDFFIPDFVPILVTAQAI